VLHEIYAHAIPRLRRAGEVVDEPTERQAIEGLHHRQNRTLPTRAVRRFAARFDVRTEDIAGFPVYTITARGWAAERTLLYLHGGGFTMPIDPVHVRYATTLARGLRARVVMPDYPPAPEHSWRDSHEPIADLAARAATREPVVLVGDSAGGGYAVAVAMTLRDRGGPTATRMVLHAPWVDLTMSSPEIPEYAARDPWLFPGKAEVWGRWWAGRTDDLDRPEVSPALGDLRGLPPALMFYGTRDLLAPGCRLLARRATKAGWPLTTVEEPDAIHVYSIMPGLPESRRALRRAVEFCR
jgi:epsilon-lactone hydrolase